MKPKKIPLRKCIGCNQLIIKKDLVRIVKNNKGDVSIDLSGKQPGRGAYICGDISCFKKTVKSKGIERALRCQISPSIYEEMERILTENE